MGKILRSYEAEEWSKASFGEKIGWYLTLRYTAEYQTLLYFSIGTAWFFYAWANFYTFGLLAQVTTIVTCTLYSILASLMGHNLMHVPMFRNKNMNTIIRFWLTMSYGLPASVYVPGHNMSHHPYPQRLKDPYRTGMMHWELPDNVGYLPGNFWNVVLLGEVVSPMLLQLELHFSYHCSKLNHPYFYQLSTEMWCCLLPWLVGCLYADWFLTIVLVLLPHKTAQTWLLVISFLQHDGCDVLPSDDADMKDHPNIARNFTGWFFNTLTMNAGYHSIHHILPMVHWSKYPVEHKKQFRDNPDPSKRIDPRLEQENFLWYFLKIILPPSLGGQFGRMRYDGKPIEFPQEHIGPDLVGLAPDLYPKDTYEKNLRSEGEIWAFIGRCFIKYWDWVLKNTGASIVHTVTSAARRGYSAWRRLRRGCTMVYPSPTDKSSVKKL